MESQYSKPRSYGNPMKMAIPPPQNSDNDRSSGELRALDCNLTSLCDHIQLEGFNAGSFSDIVVHAMGSTYHLHRLILSRSSYFRLQFSLLFLVRNREDRHQHSLYVEWISVFWVAVFIIIIIEILEEKLCCWQLDWAVYVSTPTLFVN